MGLFANTFFKNWELSKSHPRHYFKNLKLKNKEITRKPCQRYHWNIELCIPTGDEYANALTYYSKDGFNY